MKTFYRKTAHSNLLVTLQEMKNYMNVDESDHDALIDNLIRSAQDELEEYLWSAFTTTTFALYAECWPVERIELKRGPVISVTSVEYYDGNNAIQTLGTSLYFASTNVEPAYVQFLSGLPTIYNRPDAVKVNFTVGLGATAASVPDVFKDNLKRYVHWKFDNPMDSDRRWPRDVEMALFKYRQFQYDR